MKTSTKVLVLSSMVLMSTACGKMHSKDKPATAAALSQSDKTAAPKPSIMFMGSADDRALRVSYPISATETSNFAGEVSASATEVELKGYAETDQKVTALFFGANREMVVVVRETPEASGSTSLQADYFAFDAEKKEYVHQKQESNTSVQAVKDNQNSQHPGVTGAGVQTQQQQQQQTDESKESKETKETEPAPQPQAQQQEQQPQVQAQEEAGQ